MAAPPLHSFDSVRSLTRVEEDREQKLLKEEHNPLFDSLTSIEYKPEEDELAAKMFGTTLSSVKTSPKKPPSSRPGLGEKQTSGYNFDALIGDDD